MNRNEMNRLHTSPARSTPLAANRASGFTLVELLIVVSIIAILLGILLPTFAGVRAAARKASTQSLIRNVRVAFDAFQADKGRMPGHFSQQELAREENGGSIGGGGDFVGFTAMENALLELAFPQVQTIEASSLDPPAMDNSNIDIEIFDDETIDIRVNTALAGSSQSGAYLSLSRDHLAPIEGQATTIDRDGDGRDRFVGMPDVIDYFGQPIMLWQRDQSASLPPRQFGLAAGSNKGDLFAGDFFDDEIPLDDTRASFYWNTNAGYLRAGENISNVTSLQDDPTLGLGVERVPQVVLSTIGRSNRGGFGPSTFQPGSNAVAGNSDWILASLMGILAHPRFATEADDGEWPLPTQARGDAVLISAGADRVFFARKFSGGAAGAEATGNVVGYEPREAAKRAGVSGGSATDSAFGGLRTPDEFDDIIESTGG